MFEAEIARVIEREGGGVYTNRPSDRGGPTRWGVTLATLEHVLGRPCTADDVRRLTATDAIQIYREEFVLRPGFDRIPDPLLREQVIDFGVVSGPARAVRWLQRVMGTPVTG
jgi:lysozyme family protein